MKDRCSTRPVSRQGFSLVEVVLALAVCSFCLVTILGVMATGLTTDHDTTQQTAAAGIVREVTADLWAGSNSDSTGTSSGKTPAFGITLPTSTSASGPETLFFAGDGTKEASAAGAQYRVDVAFGAKQFATEPSPVRVLVTWPALANPTAGTWPTHQEGAFQTVTTLDVN